MPLLDTGYHHYDGTYRGVWYRRAVIAAAGLRATLSNPWVKRLATAAWLLCLAMIAILFLIGQLLVKDSFVFMFLDNLDPNLQGMFKELKVWLFDQPEASVHVAYNFLFFHFATKIAFLSFISLAIAIPNLITTDLASRALVVYSSRAINRFDYLLGKFGIAFGLMTILWLGPVVVAWTFGNLLAPDWRFFIYSSRALGNAVLYTTASMAILAVIALGVSAISTKEKSTGATWIAIWLLGNAFIPIGFATKRWLMNLSISYNIDQLALHFFTLGGDMETAMDKIPIFGEMIEQMTRRQNLFFMQDPSLTGALVSMGVMLFIAIVILARKVKPE